MNTWELLCVVSSSLVVGLFSGPWVALRRSFKSFHPKLVLEIVSRMGQSMSPSMTILTPITVLSMIILLIESLGANQFAWILNAGSLVLTILSLVVAIVFEVPIVNEIAAWASSSIPENWKRRRDYWIAIHKIRVFAGFGSLISLIAALVFRYR
jgi:uncharacterized membrane protein